MAHRPKRRDLILGAGAAGLATGTGTTAASGSAAVTSAPGVGSALAGSAKAPTVAWPAWASDVLVQASARAAPAHPLSGAGSSFDADAMARLGYAGMALGPRDLALGPVGLGGFLTGFAPVVPMMTSTVDLSGERNLLGSIAGER
jgi:hypothetical protein